MSATKINVYAGSFGCPRRFYNQYIAKLKQKPSINFPIGNLPHKAAEDIVKKGILKHITDYEDAKIATLNYHDAIWFKRKSEFDQFNVSDEELNNIYTESRQMMVNWLDVYWAEEPKDPVPFVEQTLWDRENKLMARIDRARKGSELGVFYIDDYKTGKSNKMWPDTKLQLVIQWQCYKATTGNTRHFVGARYLRYQEPPKYWIPTQEDIDWATDKAKYVREKTRSTDINDYPCTCGGKCQDDFIQNDQSHQIHTPEDQTETQT